MKKEMKLLSRMSVKENTIKYETTYKVKYIPKKTDFKSVQSKSPDIAAQHIVKYYEDDLYVNESFYCIFLNKNNYTIGNAQISKGGITETTVDIRIIAKYLIDTMSCSLIIAHNHPSGSLIPSKQDEEITNRIKEMCKILNVKLLDHIIVSDRNYYSFADKGLI